MTIFIPNKENYARAARIIKSGGVVAFPTETVYGLGADAFNPEAIAKIFELKKRPRFDPLIVHISDKKMLWDIAEVNTDLQNLVFILIEKFWPGPLTIILPKKNIISDIVTSGLSTVGIRMPSHPVALKFLKECSVPVAAPSANVFNYISSTNPLHIEKQFKKKVGIYTGWRTMSSWRGINNN